MTKDKKIWLGLGIFFVVALVVILLTGGDRNQPFSSYSTEPDGTKAAYLLLEELGFDVQRKTGRAWDGNGTLIALGPEYLPDSDGAITFYNDVRFTNQYIAEYAVDFVNSMWYYRDGPIVFDEYARSMQPMRTYEPEQQQYVSSSGSGLTLSDITPMWMQMTIASVLFAAFALMFFYGQRVGKPIPPEGFEGRKPLEGVFAMAGALEKTGSWAECARYYYDYCARNGNHWDRDFALRHRLDSVTNELEARQLVEQIDKTIKEYRYEGKGSF